MSALISGDHRLVLNREPAWHKMGTVMHEPMTALQALEIADLDYEVVTSPLFANVNGVVVEVPNLGVFRQPLADDPFVRHIGTVGPNYEVIQNRQIAEILEPLSRTFPVETAGALQDGRTIFFTLDMGTHNVAGANTELLKKFVMVTEGKGGDQALIAKLINTRVVCYNTHTASLAEKGLTLKVNHRKGVHGELADVMEMVAALKSSDQQLMAQFDKLALTKVVDKQIAAILEAAWPEPKRAGRQLVAANLSPERMATLSDTGREKLRAAEMLYASQSQFHKSLRQFAGERYVELGDKPELLAPQVRGTAWHVYQAVTEVADWHEPTSNAAKRSSIEFQALFGSRAEAKSRAFAEAVKVSLKK